MKIEKWGITSKETLALFKRKRYTDKVEQQKVNIDKNNQLIELTKEEFRQFSTTHPQANFQQTVEFSELLQKRGWQRVFFLGIKNKENQLIGAALLSGMKMKLGYYYEIGGGILIDYHEEKVVAQFICSLKKFVKRHNGVLLTIRPNIIYQRKSSSGSVISGTNQRIHMLLQQLKLKHEGFTHGYSAASPRCIFVKNLKRMTLNELLHSYHSTARSQINRSINSGMQVRELSEQELPIFKDIMIHTSNRKNFSDKELEYYQFLRETFKEQAKYLVVEIDIKTYTTSLFKKLVVNEEKQDHLNADTPKKKNQKESLKEERLAIQNRLDELSYLSRKIDIKQPLILACGLFIVRPNEITYLFGGMYEEYKKFAGASYLLQHHMMSYALELQIPRYNFYGISGIYDGSDGVLNFKRSFDGNVEELLGSYQSIVKPFRYFMYQQCKRILNK